MNKINKKTWKKIEKHMPYKYKVLELFGGIGAFRMALENLFKNAGIKAVDYVDILNWAVESYNRMFKNVYNPQDIKLWNMDIDFLCHGSPCQDFSFAGLRAGADEDSGTRSSELWQTIDIIKNRLHKRPKVVIWENVLGVLSKKMKMYFDKYLNIMEELGYKNSWKVEIGTDFSIPQRRRRVYVVSILETEMERFGHFSFDNLEKLELRPLNEFLEKEVDIKYFIKQKSMIKAIEQGKIKVVNNEVQTITTKQMRWNNAGVVKIPLTTFNKDNYIFDSENGTISTIQANSKIKIAVPLLEINKEYEYKLSDGSPRKVGEIKSNGSINVPITNNHTSNVVDIVGTSNDVKTITTNSNNKIFVPLNKINDPEIMPIAETKEFSNFITFGRNTDGKLINGAYNRVWKHNEPVGTIAVSNVPKIAVEIEQNENYYEVLLDKNDEVLPIFIIDNKPYHLRVLTPRECWRLMGFTDEYYDKVDDLPETAKYHLAGNSIIVPVLEAIFKELLRKENVRWGKHPL